MTTDRLGLRTALLRLVIKGGTEEEQNPTFQIHCAQNPVSTKKVERISVNKKKISPKIRYSIKMGKIFLYLPV